ncbi:unnamed protein product, partial [Ostreobium quekettii]
HTIDELQSMVATALAVFPDAASFIEAAQERASASRPTSICKMGPLYQLDELEPLEAAKPPKRGPPGPLESPDSKRVRKVPTLVENTAGGVVSDKCGHFPVQNGVAMAVPRPQVALGMLADLSTAPPALAMPRVQKGCTHGRGEDFGEGSQRATSEDGSEPQRT